jgi:hypothetical protein
MGTASLASSKAKLRASSILRSPAAASSTIHARAGCRTGHLPDFLRRSRRTRPSLRDVAGDLADIAVRRGEHDEARRELAAGNSKPMVLTWALP